MRVDGENRPGGESREGYRTVGSLRVTICITLHQWRARVDRTCLLSRPWECRTSRRPRLRSHRTLGLQRARVDRTSRRPRFPVDRTSRCPRPRQIPLWPPLLPLSVVSPSCQLRRFHPSGNKRAPTVPNTLLVLGTKASIHLVRRALPLSRHVLPSPPLPPRLSLSPALAVLPPSPPLQATGQARTAPLSRPDRVLRLAIASGPILIGDIIGGITLLLCPSNPQPPGSYWSMRYSR